MSERFSGERNPRWRGGLSASKYAPGFTQSLKDAILARDGYRCQLCGVENRTGQGNKKLTIHHANYNKRNHSERNLFTACRPCNTRVNQNRDVWQAYFEALADRFDAHPEMRMRPERRVIHQEPGLITMNSCIKDG